MGGASLILALITAAHAACDDPKVAVDDALQATFLGDFDGAHKALGRAEEAFGCGTLADTTTLADFWLVEGSLLHYQGDVAGSKESYASAARIAPERWNPDLGEALYKVYQEASSNELGQGSIDLKPKLEHYIGALDGTEVSFPVEVPEGLHLLQVGKNSEEVMFGKIVWVSPGDTSVVPTGIKEEAPKVTPPPVEEPEPPVVSVAPTTEPQDESQPVEAPISAPSEATVTPPAVVETEQLGILAYVATGGELILGSEATIETPFQVLTEPDLKLAVPVHIGLELQPTSFWLRAEFGMAPMATGHYLYYTLGATNEEEYRSVKSAITGVALIGGMLGNFQLGGGVAVFWPARLGLRGSASMQFGDLPVHLELRPGLNLTTDTSLEFTGAAFLSYRPRIQ